MWTVGRRPSVCSSFERDPSRPRAILFIRIRLVVIRRIRYASRQMPALPDVPSTLRVAISGQFSNQPWLTRFFIAYAGTAPTSTQLGTFNAAVATAINSDLKGLMNIDTTVTLIDTIDLTSPTAAVAATVESIVGTRSGGVLPSEVSLVSSYKIARRYRGGHPRGYWPFGAQTDLSNARVWLSAFLTTVTTDLGAFFTAVEAAGWSGAGTLSQVNVSYYKGFVNVDGPTGRARAKSVINPDGPIVDVVTGFTAQPSIGTQRRRIGFVD